MHRAARFTCNLRTVACRSPMRISSPDPIPTRACHPDRRGCRIGVARRRSIRPGLAHAAARCGPRRQSRIRSSPRWGATGTTGPRLGRPSRPDRTGLAWVARRGPTRACPDRPGQPRPASLPDRGGGAPDQGLPSQTFWVVCRNTGHRLALRRCRSVVDSWVIRCQLRPGDPTRACHPRRRIRSAASPGALIAAHQPSPTSAPKR